MLLYKVFWSPVVLCDPFLMGLRPFLAGTGTEVEYIYTYIYIYILISEDPNDYYSIECPCGGFKILEKCATKYQSYAMSHNLYLEHTYQIQFPRSKFEI